MDKIVGLYALGSSRINLVFMMFEKDCDITLSCQCGFRYDTEQTLQTKQF